MKILQVHTRYRQAGGEDTITREEAELLRRHGHEVIEHHADNPQGPVSSIGALAISAWNPTAAHEVREVVQRRAPDIAHVYNTWYAMSPSVLPAIRGEGVPVVMTVQNYRHMCVNSALFRDGAPCEDCVGTHPWRGVWHRCYRDSALTSAVVAANISVHRARGTWHRDVDLFLAPTDFAKERFVAAGLPAPKIVVKPNFVADPGPRSAPPSTSTEILYCGRLTAEKGITLLLDAWEAAGDTGLQLTVVGDGPLRAGLEARKPPRATFTGYLPPEETRGRMLAARALAFPSMWYEGQPLVILEALAAGLPVLTADLGGMSDIAAALGGVWQVAPGNPSSWTSALQRLDDTTVDEGGAAARKLYDERFAPPAALSALESLYESVLTSGRLGSE
ncbi:MAG TPA: glycosyltransferase family 4 protein [Egibacteraceae bacterium]|nr:glycosyltransferase family 4 protein [Egibacteraceae bacterium]